MSYNELHLMTSLTIELVLNAIANRWFGIFTRTDTKRQPRLVFVNDEVSKSLDMASRALQQKNHIIHALQLKLSELREASHSDDSEVISSHPPGMQPQLEQPCLACVGLNASLQELTEQLHRLEGQFKRILKENDDLRAALASAEKEAWDREETVTELALMLASREASQVALVETVQSYIARHIASLPATPRGPAEIADGQKPPEGEGPATNSAQYWQERLQAQAEKAALKLRNICPESDAITTDDADTLVQLKQNNSTGSDSDDAGAAITVVGASME